MNPPDRDVHAALLAQIVADSGLPLLDNPYRAKDRDGAAAQVRRDNLSVYLRWVLAARPATMWLGEAPGLGGQTQSGVPMIPDNRFAAFRRLTGQDLRENDDNAARPPATANRVWDEIERQAMMPAVWNAVPHHPHPAGRPSANRRPTRREIDHFAPALHLLVRAAGIRTVVAIGRTAQHAVRHVEDLTVVPVRHPSQGGLSQFREQIRALDAERLQRTVGA